MSAAEKTGNMGKADLGKNNLNTRIFSEAVLRAMII